MKKLTWMEIAIATPMVLVFSTLGGTRAVIIASLILGLTMIAVKWGAQLLTKKPALQPVPVKVRGLND